jgi:hypothetical protein
MSTSGRDLYAMRLHRTPVPMILARAIRCHLSKIYSREVRREGTPELVAWWADVDGAGTPIEQWMIETVAPLLLALGQIDLIFDHPSADAGSPPMTRRDLIDAGIDACFAGVILPENLLWWKLNRRKVYEECLVFERGEIGAGFRHWTTTDSNLYDKNGVYQPEYSYRHPYGIVPIRRFFDRRRVRSKNTGESQYGAVAELQRAIYNATSELILGDVQASHAVLQGPEDCLQKEATIPIGPSNILPIIKSSTGTTVSWQGWSFLDPPKGAQDAVRQHVQDFQDEADRESALSKPAGMVERSTTSQSGISKIVDQQDGNERVAAIAAVLERCEVGIAELALTVLSDGMPDPGALAQIDVEYPREFELYSLADLTEAAQDIATIVGDVGQLPETQTELVQRIASLALPGLAEDRRQVIRDEIAAYIRALAQRRPDGGLAAGGPVPTPEYGGVPVQGGYLPGEAEAVNVEPALESGPGSVTLQSPVPSA